MASQWTICTIIVWVRDGASGHRRSSAPSYISVCDEQKVVFLDSVLDCSECFSSNLDLLNSSWSIARLKEYGQKKNWSQLNGKKAESLEW